MRPPLWAIGQSSWLQIQRSGFDSRRYQIFWEVVGLERGPLSLVSKIVELLERKSSSSGLENRKYVHRNPLNWPQDTLYPQMLVLTSSTSYGLFVSVVCSQTKATEFIFYEQHRLRCEDGYERRTVSPRHETGRTFFPSFETAMHIPRSKRGPAETRRVWVLVHQDHTFRREVVQPMLQAYAECSRADGKTMNKRCG
jgi:hypothetical protein